MAFTKQWRWKQRSPALQPLAAIGWGATALSLHRWLEGLKEEQYPSFQLTATTDLLIVSGPETELPWVQGIAYAAPCPEAPALWLPTCLEPDIPAALLAQRLEAEYQRKPLLLWPDPAHTIPLDRLTTLSPTLLPAIRGFYPYPTLNTTQEA